VKKKLKRLLLQHGGYTVARKISARLEYHSLLQRYLRFMETGSAALPDRVMFEPTQRCNLRCRMCFQDRKEMASSKELAYEQITEFYDRNPCLQKVTFIGGEVFVRTDSMDLIRHLNRSRQIVICTNGTLIRAADLEELKRLDNVYTVCISLDGPRDIHDSIRRVAGSYDRTIRTIQALAPSVPVTVNLVIQGENLPFIPEMIDICASIHVKKVKIEIERLYPPERQARVIRDFGLLRSEIPLASEGRLRGYSAENLENTLRESVKRGRKKRVDIFIDPPYLMENLKACYRGSLLEDRRFICQNIHTATITPNGELVHCIHIRKSFGNILNAPLEEIWNSESATAFRRRLLVKNMTALCENCPFMSPAPDSIIRKIPAFSGRCV
jgi:radical SAM protein with 4Fe4S-binding SPASM domain